MSKSGSSTDETTRDATRTQIDEFMTPDELLAQVRASLAETEQSPDDGTRSMAALNLCAAFRELDGRVTAGGPRPGSGPGGRLSAYGEAMIRSWLASFRAATQSAAATSRSSRMDAGLQALEVPTSKRPRPTESRRCVTGIADRRSAPARTSTRAMRVLG
jgi:hypothetical protein